MAADDVMWIAALWAVIHSKPGQKGPLEVKIDDETAGHGAKFIAGLATGNKAASLSSNTAVEQAVISLVHAPDCPAGDNLVSIISTPKNATFCISGTYA